MKCIHASRINQYLHRPLYKFLGGFHVLRTLADRETASPVEFIADGFVANVDPGESYEAWLCRQVKEIIETGLFHDDLAEGAQGKLHATVHQKIVGVELDEDDVRYVIETFGPMSGLALMYQGLAVEKAA